MAEAELDRRIMAVRRFNRFYTGKIGVLREGVYRSPFSLTEVRVLYELAHRDGLTATALARELGIDQGYLSRILRGFGRRGYVDKRRSASDGRQSHLALTLAGRRAFAPLNRRSHEEVGALVGALRPADQQKLVQAMDTIERLLGGQRTGERAVQAVVLRPHRPGDMGWVIERHAQFYHQEYGWDESFEALVADIAARFIRDFDARRERCWIAERDGARVGSVLLVAKSKTVAKLRLLLVDPSARGLGIGRRLVEECIRFARQTGYRTLTLWTNDILHAARRIYEEAGFRLIHSERHRSFGRDLVGETWELKL